MTTIYAESNNSLNNPMKHNYMRKLLKLRKRGELVDGVHIAHIYHDDWCKIYNNEYCNCTSDIEIENVE